MADRLCLQKKHKRDQQRQQCWHQRPALCQTNQQHALQCCDRFCSSKPLLNRFRCTAALPAQPAHPPTSASQRVCVRPRPSRHPAVTLSYPCQPCLQCCRPHHLQTAHHSTAQRSTGQGVRWGHQVCWRQKLPNHSAVITATITGIGTSKEEMWSRPPPATHSRKHAPTSITAGSRGSLIILSLLRHLRFVSLLPITCAVWHSRQQIQVRSSSSTPGTQRLKAVLDTVHLAAHNASGQTQAGTDTIQGNRAETPQHNRSAHAHKAAQFRRFAAACGCCLECHR